MTKVSAIITNAQMSNEVNLDLLFLSPLIFSFISVHVFNEKYFQCKLFKNIGISAKKIQQILL